MLSKDLLFKTAFKTKKVTVSGGTITIREFTTADREQFEKYVSGDKIGPSIKAKLIVMSTINENGSNFFGDDDIDKISQLPSTLTESLFTQILKLNEMNPNSTAQMEGN